VRPLALLRESLKWPMVASLPAGLLCLLVTWVARDYTNRVGNIALAAGCAATFTIAYGLCLRSTPFLDAYDVGFLRETLRLDRLPGYQFMTARVALKADATDDAMELNATDPEKSIGP